MKNSFFLFFAVLTILFASCGTAEKYVLVNDVEVKDYVAPKRNTLHIKKGDELQILVAHKVPRVVEEFNQKVNTPGEEDHGAINTYLVNNDGYINFPILDTIYVVGMTCSELERELVRRIESEGLATGATANVRIRNFKVTVIGESRTDIYEFDDENVTIFDLVAEANLTNSSGGNNYGGSNIRRDKILIMRDCDTTIRMDYISLLSTDILYSPYYYLQQNDIVYVYPSQTAIRNSNRIFDFWWSRLSILTTAISAVSLVLTLLNKNS